ncbi:MAG: hypothetical protein OXB84_08135 [Halobacteriovoraceae bacterium]|nr:hypothetical protein [Halobacteriovoraceae bacterium]
MIFSMQNVPTWALGATTRDVASGVGVEAIEILRTLVDLNLHAQKSVTLGTQTRLLNEIESLKTGFSEEGWDGYDALPISPEATNSAMAFAQQLPDAIVTPEITPENDGGVSFDWSNGKDLMFSISVLSRNIIYAGIIGSQKFHGESPFVREIPENVVKVLTDYFSRVD